MKRFMPLLCLVVFTGVASGCTRPIPGGDSDDDKPGGNVGAGTGASGTQQSDWAAIERLEGEAKALATTTGCSASGDCRSAPVGSRACGGPRYYLPYCAKSTDSVALFRKLEAVAKAEQAYNAKYQIMSTCEFRMPPEIRVVGGACVAQ